VFVLPSFYEGLPLVLVEAFACGCRLVATELTGIVSRLAPGLGDALELVPPPRMAAVDSPHPEDVPDFTARLTTSIERSLDRPPLGDPAATMPEVLSGFTWRAVFQRVEVVWQDLL
jgi:glycosyltransferase involved in cell wall biosynthesis